MIPSTDSFPQVDLLRIPLLETVVPLLGASRGAAGKKLLRTGSTGEEHIVAGPVGTIVAGVCRGAAVLTPTDHRVRLCLTVVERYNHAIVEDEKFTTPMMGARLRAIVEYAAL